MNIINKIFNKLINGIIATCLGAMTILVFVNVVLRYGFETGITWSEEMSRFLFIWMIFFGAILAFKEKEHIGVDILIRKLPLKAKKGIYILSNISILVLLILLFDGSYKIAAIAKGSHAPITGIPMEMIQGIGVVFSFCIAMVVMFNLYKVIFNKLTEKEMSMTSVEEE